MRNIQLTASALTIIAATSSVSFAQQNNTGFLTATDARDGLLIQARSTGTYSDNILRFSDIDEQDSLALDPDFEISDYVLDVGGDLTLRKRLGRNVLSLDAGFGYRFHNNNTILDNERFNGTALFAWQLGSRCTGSFGGTWSRALAQFETITDITDNTITTLSAGGQANCNILRSLQLSGSAIFSTAENSSVTREVNDFDSEAYTGSLRYAFGRESYIGAFYQYTETGFDNRIDLVGANSSFTTQTVGGEFGLTFGRGWQINATAGVVNVEGEGGIDATSDDLDGFSGRLSVIVPFGSNQRLEFQAFQDVRALEAVTAAVARIQGGEFIWDGQWSPRLSSQFNVLYQDRTLTQDVLAVDPIEGFNMEDETLQFSLSLNYRLGRLITLSLLGRTADRNASNDRFDFVENSIILGLTVNFN